MTNDKKQQAIIEAYQALGMKVPKDCNENGWSDDSNFKNVGEEFYETEIHYEFLLARPTPLEGIESNNGWTRIIEDGSNLPKDNSPIYCMFEDLEGYQLVQPSIEDDEYHGSDGWMYRGRHITHYQPIVKPKPPIY